jgi:hypothetical protein
MNREELDIRVARDFFDRRCSQHLPPPYLTDEGFVLIDRRASPDRRESTRQSAVADLDSEIKGVCS